MYSRHNGLDLLRGIAAFGIVGCHLNLDGDILVLHFCDMNVGVFATISGFLLARSIDVGGANLIGVITHKLKRLLPIYLFWSLVYILLGGVFDLVVDGEIGHKFLSQSFWISVVFNGGASCHLWYLSSLCYGILLFVPVLFHCKKHPSVKILLAPASLVLLLASFVMNGDLWLYTARMFSFVAVGVVLWDIRDLVCKVHVGVFAVLFFVLAYLSIVLSVWPHHFVPDYLCAVTLVALFLHDFKPNKVGALLSATSLCVYLVHPIFTALNGCVVRKMCSAPYPINVVLIDWIVSWLMALVASYVLVRIRVINRFVR